MTRTAPLVVLLWALVGAASGFAIDAWLAGTGRAVIVPPVSLGVALVALGALLLAAAWPVRRAARGGRSIGFRHATTVLGLAKASSIVGSLFGGLAIGVLVFVLTRPVVTGAAIGPVLIALAGGVVLTIAGLVAEAWCALPPEDDAASGAEPDPA